MQQCIDPVEICSCYKGEGSDECDDGRRNQTVDGDDALAWVYFASTMDPAIWGAELARGSNPERIYVVEALGEVVDYPNLTDKKFPVNPSMSYRSREPLRVVAELVGWHGHTDEQVRQMKVGLTRLAAEGNPASWFLRFLMS